LTIVLIAHRGGTDKHPELTIAGALNSLAIGADYVEFDIRLTKDHVPVISHDKTALKLFGNPSKISDLSLKQFKNLRYACDDRYTSHTMEEVLSSGIEKMLFHIKEGGNALAKILEYIRFHNCENKVIIGVTTIKDAYIVKSYNREIKVLGFMKNKDQITQFIESDIEILRLWEDWVDEDTVNKIHKAYKQVWVMTGSAAKGTLGYTHPEKINEWKQIGVDGILVNEIEKTKMP